MNDFDAPDYFEGKGFETMQLSYTKPEVKESALQRLGKVMGC